MHPSIERHRAAIEELCRRYDVSTLDVFGSATTDEFDVQRSDVDFLVEFQRGSDGLPLGDYFALKEALEELLGHPVDLVSPARLENPFFRAGVEETREHLYAA